MYATDPLARHFAHDAIDAGMAAQVAEELRLFFYLPFNPILSRKTPAQEQAFLDQGGFAG